MECGRGTPPTGNGSRGEGLEFSLKVSCFGAVCAVFSSVLSPRIIVQTVWCLKF